METTFSRWSRRPAAFVAVAWWGPTTSVRAGMKVSEGSCGSLLGAARCTTGRGFLAFGVSMGTGGAFLGACPVAGAVVFQQAESGGGRTCFTDVVLHRICRYGPNSPSQRGSTAAPSGGATMSARGAGCWSHHCTLDSDCLLWSAMGCVAKTAASCPGVCAGTSLDLSGRSCLTGKEIPNTPDVTTCSNAECIIFALPKRVCL